MNYTSISSKINSSTFLKFPACGQLHGYRVIPGIAWVSNFGLLVERNLWRFPQIWILQAIGFPINDQQFWILLPHFRKSAYIICIMGVQQKPTNLPQRSFHHWLTVPAFAELTWIWQEIDLHWIDFWMNFRWSFHYIQFFLCTLW